jgi:uncharacterized protein
VRVASAAGESPALHTRRLPSFIAAQAGASPKCRNSDGKSATELAEEKGRRDLTQLLRRAALGAYESVYKMTVLNIAKDLLGVGDVEALEELLKEEAAAILNDFLPDLEGDTSLHYAASLPFIGTTALLLQHSLTKLNAGGSLGRRPVHYAASSGDVATVRLLLDAGAEIDAVADDGSTALILACAKGHASVAEILLERGSNASMLDSSGLAAIHHAVRSSSTECVSVLGASANSLDARRDPPLYVCC